MTNILAPRCKNIVKKDVICQKITQFALFRGKGGAINKKCKRMFSISILPQLNTTFFIFTLGVYDQYFGVQMQKYSKKGRNLPKNYTICAI